MFTYGLTCFEYNLTDCIMSNSKGKTLVQMINKDFNLDKINNSI